jgi:hypothetical protein
VIKKPSERGGHSPRRAAEPEKKIIILLLEVRLFSQTCNITKTKYIHRVGNENP